MLQIQERDILKHAICIFISVILTFPRKNDCRAALKLKMHVKGEPVKYSTLGWKKDLDRQSQVL